MRRLLPLLFPVLLGATPKDFNGRWDITLADDPRNRAWWLEVTGAGTPGIAGSFVGAPGGQVDKIPEIRVTEKGELEFVFQRKYLRSRKDEREYRGIYRAKLANGKLEGTHEVEGTEIRSTWTGVRAPKLKDRDDGKWTPGKPVELFNGRDLSGWKPQWKTGRLGWVVENGVLKNQPPTADIVTEQKFWNFQLRVEYRVGPKSNSGIALRGRYEVQIYDDHGEPPSLHGNGALYSRIAPAVNASRRPGEWQTMDIRLIGGELSVLLNGARIIDRQQVTGLTAMASDPHELLPGPIAVQGDHGAVEFRKMTLTPLTRGKARASD